MTLQVVLLAHQVVYDLGLLREQRVRLELDAEPFPFLVCECNVAPSELRLDLEESVLDAPLEVEELQHLGLSL